MNRWRTGSINKFKYNIHPVRNRKKLEFYSDDILTFDIEVTSAWLKDGKLIPYEPGHDAEEWHDPNEGPDEMFRFIKVIK